MRHTLTSGEWIDVLPISGLKAKHKDAVEAAIKMYVSIDENGKPEMKDMPFTMSIPKAQRNVLMAMCISAWSFTIEDGAALPVPQWHADGDMGLIENEDSFGEIGIDDFNEIEEWFEPYLAKTRRRPDPKGTTTANSSGTSPGRASVSRKG